MSYLNTDKEARRWNFYIVRRVGPIEYGKSHESDYFKDDQGDWKIKWV